MSTKFFTNHNGNSLLKKFNGAFEHIANIYAFHAVVGYFRASGYYAIREHLMKVPEVKILVGINVDAVSAEAKRRGLMFFGDPEKSRDEFIKWMRQDIKDAAYTKEVEDGILRFMEDIMDKKIQIRVHKTKKLHAKIYIFLPKNFNEYSGGEVITGSSNLTSSGLGMEDEGNYEFNVALRDYDDVLFAENEFIKLWEDGEEILPIDIDRIKNRTHIGQLFTPFEIYIKFLIEYFGKNIEYDPDTVGDLPKNFKKLSYQVDAVNQGYQMILDHNGFILADVVGLGKTVIASMIAKRFLIANGTLNSKILVVYPPPLEKNWKSTFRQFGLDKHTRFISNGSLHKILKDNEDYWPKEDYDLILVDEAHKFRNHKSIMFDNLQTICKAPRSIIGNVYGARKKVILISATPLNNRPDDIYYQLQLFQDARKSTLPTTNLQSFFAPLVRKYKEILAAAKVTGRPDVEALRKIYGDIRNKILEPITVRRTRTDVKKYPAYLKDLEEQGIHFPDIAPPKALEYELGPNLENLFYSTIGYLVDEIGYFRYQAIAYLLPEIQDKYYTQAERISKTLAQIMMTQMVKRLESSFYAFKKSLNRFRVSTERMIKMFEKGKVYVAPSTNINALMDQDWSDEQIEEKILELSAEDPKNQIFSPDDFNKDFLELLKEDLKHITHICTLWDTVTEDPKLDLFKKVLKNELFRLDINKTGKLVIFTESKETADYLTKQLSYPKTLTVSADNRKTLFDVIQKNFDANYSGTFSNDFDIIISTEVLAEGVNLHRSNIIVNYDTPWNATKLMQRIGRVNRIGSLADVIYNYAFYPSRQSDKLINLYNNAYIKLQGFHTAFGEDSRIYTVEEVLEQVKLHTQGLGEDEDKRLIYLSFIRDFKMKNEKEFKRIKSLPLKARTGRKPGKQHKDIKGGSLVFMKSPYKTEFYKVDEKGAIEGLTFISAAELFEAKVNEPSEALPTYHHSHVEKATAYFEKELFSSTTDTLSGEHADAKTNQAKKFIRELRADSRDEKFRDAAETILLMLDRGTIANLSGELNKLRLKYNKGDIKVHAVENLVMQYVARYTNTNTDIEDADGLETPLLPIEVTHKPDIILSESFLD